MFLKPLGIPMSFTTCHNCGCSIWSGVPNSQGDDYIFVIGEITNSQSDNEYDFEEIHE